MSFSLASWPMAEKIRLGNGGEPTQPGSKDGKALMSMTSATCDSPALNGGMEQEQQWIREAVAGDRGAFSRLVHAYQHRVFNLCYRMLGNYAEAEDAAQETFLRAYSRLSTYDINRSFTSWLLSISSHYCIDCLRRRRINWLDLDDLQSPPENMRTDEQPEKAYLRNEEDEYVREMLITLPPLYRSIVVLRYWQDLSYAEISEVLGITESAVKSRLHRARRAMAESLKLSSGHEAHVQIAQMG